MLSDTVSLMTNFKALVSHTECHRASIAHNNNILKNSQSTVSICLNLVINQPFQIYVKYHKCDFCHFLLINTF